MKKITSDKFNIKEICCVSVIGLWLLGVLWGTIHTWCLIVKDIMDFIAK